MNKSTKQSDGIKMSGFFRLQIAEKDGTIVGDSGFMKNTVTNVGKQDYLSALLGNTTGSKQVKYLALGTGTAPNVTHTGLDGEIMTSTKRVTVAVSVSTSSKVRFTATFVSTDRSAAYNIRNIGLFETTTAGNLFAGSTYASSTAATNQNVKLGAVMRQLMAGNPLNSGKPSFNEDGNPEPSLGDQEGVETRQGTSLWDEEIVQPTNTVN